MLYLTVEPECRAHLREPWGSLYNSSSGRMKEMLFFSNLTPFSLPPRAVNSATRAEIAEEAAGVDLPAKPAPSASADRDFLVVTGEFMVFRRGDTAHAGLLDS